MMQAGSSKFKNASRETKYFALNWSIYGLAIILTTAYCYGRIRLRPQLRIAP